jgi:hypothetical protein
MARIIISHILSGMCFLVAIHAFGKLDGGHRSLRDWTYAQDVTMQLIAVGLGFGIGLLTRRPVLWGAVISICGIVACFTVVHWFENQWVCRMLPFG